jgi:hypothetical protein
MVQNEMVLGVTLGSVAILALLFGVYWSLRSESSRVPVYARFLCVVIWLNGLCAFGGIVWHALWPDAGRSVWTGRMALFGVFLCVFLAYLLLRHKYWSSPIVVRLFGLATIVTVIVAIAFGSPYEVLGRAASKPAVDTPPNGR